MYDLSQYVCVGVAWLRLSKRASAPHPPAIFILCKTKPLYVFNL